MFTYSDKKDSSEKMEEMNRTLSKNELLLEDKEEVIYFYASARKSYKHYVRSFYSSSSLWEGVNPHPNNYSIDSWSEIQSDFKKKISNKKEYIENLRRALDIQKALLQEEEFNMIDIIYPTKD